METKEQKEQLNNTPIFTTKIAKTQERIATTLNNNGISIQFHSDTLDEAMIQDIMEQIAEQLDKSEKYGSGSEGDIYKLSILLGKNGKSKDLLIAKKRFDNKPNNEVEIHKKLSNLTQEGDPVQVPKLWGIFEHRGYNYIIMDFIKGKTLYHMIAEAILKKQADLMVSNGSYKSKAEQDVIASNADALKRMVEDADSDEKIASLMLRYCNRNREKVDELYKNSDKLKIKLFSSKDGKKIKESIQNFINMIHQNGFYHRDLHEKNIIFGDDGKIYVIDFGKSIFRDPKLGKPSKNDIYEEQAGELIGRYCDDEDIISILSGLIKTKEDEDYETLRIKSIEEEKRITSGDMIIKYIDLTKLKSKTLINKIKKIFGSFEEFKKRVEKEEKSKVAITSLTGGIEDEDLLLTLFSQTKENLNKLLNEDIPNKKTMELAKLKETRIYKYGKDDRTNLFEEPGYTTDEKISKLQEITKKMRKKDSEYEKYYKKMDFIRELKPYMNRVNELVEIQKVETYLNAIRNAIQ